MDGWKYCTNISLIADASDGLARLQLGPPLREGVQLDEVPDCGQRGIDDGRFSDGGGSRNRHFGFEGATKVGYVG